ncbi:hypothetical protein PK28_01885 [Hymenobacter sp. DG25B]|nr:hypothetical protein PK28_01885 [Hymenobacter sp. DG25B]
MQTAEAEVPTDSVKGLVGTPAHKAFGGPAKSAQKGIKHPKNIYQRAEERMHRFPPESLKFFVTLYLERGEVPMLTLRQGAVSLLTSNRSLPQE